MKYVERAAGYIEDVIDGYIPACALTIQACERQLRDLKRQRTKAFPFYFDIEAAERPCAFIEKLPHIKGIWAKRGENLELHPSQAFFITTLFGWRTADTVIDADGLLLMESGTRRFRTAYLEVARKNTKSTLAAGIALYMLCDDDESGAECYSTATSHKQARIVWDVAKAMAEKSPGFRQHWAAHCGARSIFVLGTASKFEALHAQGETLDGLNVHLGICDELHAHKTRALFDVIETATGSRAQPLILSITTAGTDKTGICYEQRTYLSKVLQRLFDDDTYFGVIYTLDDDDEPMDRAVWPKANPMYGVSVYPLDMERLAKKAQESPASLNNFMTKRLNVWCGSEAAWLDMRAWEKCADSNLDEADFSRDQLWLGVDLASKKDLSAVVRLYKRVVDGETHVYCFPSFYLPELAIETESNSQYKGWKLRGLLTPTAGNIIDMDHIEDDVTAAFFAANGVECCFDPGHNATQWAGHLEDAGVEMVEVRPTVLNFSEPMKWLEALVIDGRFHHSGNDILSWCMSNVVVVYDRKDNIFPRKERVENKIDGAVAVCLGMNRLLADENADSDPQVIAI